MKKILLLLLITSLFIGCSKDDNNNGDRIIGKWGLTKQKSNDGSIKEFNGNKTYEFKEDNTYVRIGGAAGGDPIINNTSLTGTWKKREGDKYDLKLDSLDHPETMIIKFKGNNFIWMRHENSNHSEGYKRE